MKTIKQVYHIKAPLEKVWQALVDPKVMDEWSGGPAKMTAKEGSSFSLWGGDIHGTNLEIVDKSTLVQEWYSGDWPTPSKVSFTLANDKGETKVELLHENVPKEDADDIAEGWDIYYLGVIKEFLEKKRA